MSVASFGFQCSDDLNLLRFFSLFFHRRIKTRRRFVGVARLFRWQTELYTTRTREWNGTISKLKTSLGWASLMWFFVCIFHAFASVMCLQVCCWHLENIYVGFVNWVGCISVLIALLCYYAHTIRPLSFHIL